MGCGSSAPRHGNEIDRIPNQGERRAISDVGGVETETDRSSSLLRGWLADPMGPRLDEFRDAYDIVAVEREIMSRSELQDVTERLRDRLKRVGALPMRDILNTVRRRVGPRVHVDGISNAAEDVGHVQVLQSQLHGWQKELYRMAWSDLVAYEPTDALRLSVALAIRGVQQCHARKQDMFYAIAVRADGLEDIAKEKDSFVGEEKEKDNFVGEEKEKDNFVGEEKEKDSFVGEELRGKEGAGVGNISPPKKQESPPKKQESPSKNQESPPKKQESSPKKQPPEIEEHDVHLEAPGLVREVSDLVPGIEREPSVGHVEGVLRRQPSVASSGLGGVPAVRECGCRWEHVAAVRRVLVNAIADRKMAALRSAFVEPATFAASRGGNQCAADHVLVHGVNAYLSLLAAVLGVQCQRPAVADDTCLLGCSPFRDVIPSETMKAFEDMERVGMPWQSLPEAVRIESLPRPPDGRFYDHGGRVAIPDFVTVAETSRESRIKMVPYFNHFASYFAPLPLAENLAAALTAHADDLGDSLKLPFEAFLITYGYDPNGDSRHPSSFFFDVVEMTFRARAMVQFLIFVGIFRPDIDIDKIPESNSSW